METGVYMEDLRMKEEGLNVYAMGKQLEQEAKQTIQGMLISQKNRWIK